MLFRKYYGIGESGFDIFSSNSNDAKTFREIQSAFNKKKATVSLENGDTLVISIEGDEILSFGLDLDEMLEARDLLNNEIHIEVGKEKGELKIRNLKKRPISNKNKKYPGNKHRRKKKERKQKRKKKIKKAKK
ncbi:hypothetical protein KAT95_01435 [Candidatus Parcubacteria bacterium]|nr:hypothetical protein [Candidatus Parcubacteria bacterium]